MHERISISDKKPEAKSQNLVTQIRRKTESFQSMNSPVDRILFLQRTIGNHAVSRMIESGGLQAKLRIGQPGDVYEQEADRVAEQVMRMPDVSEAKDTRVQRKCPKCLKGPTGLLGKDKKDEKLQAKETPGQTPEITPHIENNINALKGGGQPLSESTSAFFETRFGHDFSHVRVHTDAKASESAKEVNAQAYTVGQDVVFGVGWFAPGTQQGRQLLAHELTHVVQQSEATPVAGGESAGSGATVAHRSPMPKIMRSSLFTSTMKICHRVLESRGFAITEGGLKVTTFAQWKPSDEWQGTRAELQCGNPEFHITLVRDDPVFDNDFGDCTFPMGVPFSRQWTDLSDDDDWYLTIWTNNTNPNCCLEGYIEVAQERGLSGHSCTKPPPGPMEIIHTGLDMAGLIPFLGVLPDLVNTGIYLVEGDWTNAGISAAGTVPYIGGAAISWRRGKVGLRIAARDAEKLGAEGIAKGAREARAAEKKAATEMKAVRKEAEDAAKAGGKASLRILKLPGCRVGSLHCPITYLYNEFADLYQMRGSAPFFKYLRSTSEVDLNFGRSLRKEMTILTGDPMYAQFLREVPRSEWAKPFREEVDLARRLGVDYREINLGGRVGRWPLDATGAPWVVHHDPPLGWAVNEASQLWHPMPYRIHESAHAWWSKLEKNVKARLKESGLSKDTIKEIFGREDALDIRNL